jgi:hypothetical protein
MVIGIGLMAPKKAKVAVLDPQKLKIKCSSGILATETTSLECKFAYE